MVQALRLVPRPGVSSGRNRVFSRCFILPDGVQGRGQAFSLGERHPVWGLPLLRLRFSAGRLDCRQDEPSDNLIHYKTVMPGSLFL